MRNDVPTDHPPSTTGWLRKRASHRNIGIVVVLIGAVTMGVPMVGADPAPPVPVPAAREVREDRPSAPASEGPGVLSEIGAVARFTANASVTQAGQAAAELSASVLIDIQQAEEEAARLEAERQAENVAIWEEAARKAAAEEAALREAARAAEAAKAAEAAAASGVSDGSVWDALAQCEAGGNWAINTGNGYYGGLQFSLSSWQGVGGTGYPHEASRETQIAMGERLRANGGWGHWPACSRKLGLR